MRRNIWVAVLMAMNLGLAASLPAQTNNWGGILSADWQAGFNWSLGLPPDISQSAVIITNNGNATKTVAITSAAQPSTLIISNLEVTSGTVLLDNLGTLSLHVVNNLDTEAFGEFSSGALVSSNSTLIVDGLKGGEFIIEGGRSAFIGGSLITTNCSFDVSTALFLMSNSVGRVRDARIDEGALLEILGGSMNVAAELDVVGIDDFSSLVLANGGVLVATNSDTSIEGDEGIAAMTVSNATFLGAGISVKGSADGSAGLTIDNGTVTATGELCVGCGWVTAHAVLNGGLLVVTNNQTVIGDGVQGYGFQGFGTLTIQAGTFLGREVLDGISSNCTGEFDINGGTVQLSSYLQIGSVTNSIGIVNIVSGGQMIVTNGEILLDHTGDIVVSPGGLLAASHIADNGQLTDNSGIVTASTGITLGDCASNTVGNLTVGLSGEVIATNAAGTGFVDVRDGDLVVNNATLRVDQLVMTNPCGAFSDVSGTVIAGKVVLDPNAFRIKSVVRQGNNLLVTWLMGPGISNFLQVATGRPDGSYSTNGFTNIFVVLNNSFPGTVTNFLDVGGATNRPARYYRAGLVP